MLVELKNGETYNGHLVSCDSWMNINLRDVICTSKDGDRFWRMPECYIRGNTIKYLRIPDEVIDMVKEDAQAKTRSRTEINKSRQGTTQNQNQRIRGGNRNNGSGRSVQGALSATSNMRQISQINRPSNKDGDRFWRMPECYIRGNTIKYLRIPDEVIDMVKEDAQAKTRSRTEINKSRQGTTQNQNQRIRGGNRNNGSGRSVQGALSATSNMRQISQINRPSNKVRK